MRSIRESDIQKSILDYLRLKKYFCWKNSTTGIYVKARDTFIPSQNVGSPDVFVVVPTFDHHIDTITRQTLCQCIFGQIWGLEVKNEKGKQTSAQRDWEKVFKKNGGRYLLVRSLDEIMKVL